MTILLLDPPSIFWRAPLGLEYRFAASRSSQAHACLIKSELETQRLRRNCTQARLCSELCFSRSGYAAVRNDGKKHALVPARTHLQIQPAIT
jgi:hypothetical protein